MAAAAAGSRQVQWLKGAAIPAGIVVLWCLSTQYQWVSQTILVSPWQMLEALQDPTIRGAIIDGIGASLLRLAEGAVLGIAAGLIVGFAIALSGILERLFSPSLNAIRQIAIFAWIPLLTAWFGDGDLGKVVFIAFGSFFPVVLGVHEGVRAVPPQLREVGEVLCLGPWRSWWVIILPAAAPAIITAVQLSLLLSWVATVGAEYLMGGMAEGVGSFVMMGQEQVRPDIVLLGVSVIVVSGFIFTLLVRAGCNYLLRRRGII